MQVSQSTILCVKKTPHTTFSTSTPKRCFPQRLVWTRIWKYSNTQNWTSCDFLEQNIQFSIWQFEIQCILSSFYMIVKIEAHQFVTRKSCCNCWIAKAIHSFCNPSFSCQYFLQNRCQVSVCTWALTIAQQHKFLPQFICSYFAALTLRGGGGGIQRLLCHKKQERVCPKKKDFVIFFQWIISPAH